MVDDGNVDGAGCRPPPGLGKSESGIEEMTTDRDERGAAMNEKQKRKKVREKEETSRRDADLP
jgi:hypothetical protein